jgi:hypothetical protein
MPICVRGRRLSSLWYATLVIFAGLLTLRSTPAYADPVSDSGYRRFATSTAFNNFLGNGHQCTEPFCTSYGTTDGGQVYTSDYVAAQLVSVYTPDMPNGGSISWQATKPDNSVETLASVTWDATSGYWVWSDGSEWADPNDVPIFFLVGAPVNCQSAGGWSLQTLENGSPLLSHSFSLSDASPLLAISSPTLNQLFDLDQNNFTDTDNVPYNATTNTGNSISWAATLNYKTSGGYGITLTTLPGFGTTSGEEHDETYQSEGGQVKVTASTTASDGSTIQDCVTYYIDGPQGGITDGNITTQLETSAQSYPSSKSYPSDGTGTSALMAQVAVKESSYAQFLYPGEGFLPQPDVFSRSRRKVAHGRCGRGRLHRSHAGDDGLRSDIRPQCMGLVHKRRRWGGPVQRYTSGGVRHQEQQDTDGGQPGNADHEELPARGAALAQRLPAREHGSSALRTRRVQRFEQAVLRTYLLRHGGQ